MRTLQAWIALACLLAWPGPAAAQPIDHLDDWEGTIGYFVIGAPLAIDGPDTDTTLVDTIDQPASVVVAVADVPASATVVAAYLYWAGTIRDQGECATTAYTDDEVELTLPGMTTTTAIVADECFCSPGATSYDIQACRADITTRVAASGMNGTFSVEGFDCLIRNSATDNASFALVLVFEEPDLLPPRRVALYDGLEEFYETSRTLNLGGLDADTPAHGEISWYALDGDEGGAPPEEVRVTGIPGGGFTVVSDSVNPADNPMNHTINTTAPPSTDVIGVDIDMLDISDGLTPGDTAVDMTYTAGGDKYWVVVNIVGIDVYRAVIPSRYSSKHWELHDDADSDGAPTPGDTIRYTIHLENVGTAPGYVDVEDDISTSFSSWTLVDAGGGTDASTPSRLVVNDVLVPIDGTAEIVFDAVIGPGTDGVAIPNVVSYDASPDGNAGSFAAPPVVVGAEPPDEGGPEEEPEPVTDAATDPDVPPDTAADAEHDAPADAVADTAPPAGGGSSGCGCSVPGAVPVRGILPILVALGLIIRRFGRS